MPRELRNITLDDKYLVESGTVFASGAQVLARLPMLQRQLDKAKGLNTAGFISGYRGSPLGHLDMTLWRVKEHLAANNIVFQPGINEDLAATAVSGTQQLGLLPDPACDGVFAMWYGKGPGVDRSMDAFKHGNYGGSHPNGGVLLVYGDDHPGKSSTVSHQSEQALAAQLIPSLYPASASEFIRFGLLGWALSRFSGAWVGLKTVNETIEQTATFRVELDDFEIRLPPVGGHVDVHNRGSLVSRIENERIAYEDRLERVRVFVRSNGIDEVIVDPGVRRLGIVSGGKSCMDVLQALEMLGIDGPGAARYGVAVYKVGCIWPLEPVNALEFTRGLAEICVVEEKKPFIEQQLASLLINKTDRPALSGKSAPDGSRQFSSIAPLSPEEIALVIGSRLEALGQADDQLRRRVAALRARPGGAAPADVARAPFFCSGCPHNRSTRIPDGSRAIVGTGCATMEVFFRPDRIVPAQMGGEGANWLGLAPFTRTPHVFQNLGDGTYFHSGLLSIRAAVAAKANITFKILYNDAVAMTGGQPVDGPLSPVDIAAQVLAEHVERCVIVAEDPSLYRNGSSLPPGVDVFHRDALDRIQRELRETKGCTILIYEQTCAAEKRRRRKRNLMPDPENRMFIYDPVCEGCGDCSEQSNCVSIQPLETPFGLKRRIDQFSCNKDYSCKHGFCPSFVTVRGGRPRKGDSVLPGDRELADIPAPQVADSSGNSYNVMIAGIGGTGVVTIGAVLGMAAHRNDGIVRYST
jgi:indolepyruvate ferredoxin oxidoreductase